jgi:acyl transferase domain-containing protein
LHDVDMALAGGVTVHPTPGGFVSLARAGMTSSRGRCRTFDADADGFVPAEAVVVFVLKREVDALRDGDTIRAVIVASGTNQDGATNGITAPSARSQESLQRRVYETFGVSPADIDMVEAHGTATELGDPIEFSALTRSFRRYTDATGYCAIGSIKSSMGHATAAAGCAGLLRIVLSLLHERIPSPLHFDTPNPRIAIADSPFHVNRSALSWPRGKRLDGRAARRMAALNSFGMSGTNVHMVIAEAPVPVQRTPRRSAELAVLSARTQAQLHEQVAQLLAHLKKEPTLAAGDLAHTLLVGRRHMAHRFACVYRDLADLAGAL